MQPCPEYSANLT